MRKIRLEVDTLKVETFAPAEAPKARGTVRGYVSLYWEDCWESETCPGGYPCNPTQQSCAGTCFENTCHPGCGSGGGGSHPGLGVPCSTTCNDGNATNPGDC